MWNKIIPIGFTVALAAIIFGMLSLVGSEISEAANNTNTTTIINQGNTFLSNFSSQLPTIGTILGVMLLFIVVIGVFGKKRGWF